MKDSDVESITKQENEKWDLWEERGADGEG